MYLVVGITSTLWPLESRSKTVPLCVSCCGDGYDRVMIRSTDKYVFVPCRIVGCYGYRNAVVLYTSPLNVCPSWPGPEQGTNIFYTFPGFDTTFCFSERVNKWHVSKLIHGETFLPWTSKLPKDIPRLCLSTVWATASTLLCCCSWGRHHLGKSTSQDKSRLPRVQGNLKISPF